MLSIHLMRFDPVLVFAAEELKKYLRMMMPQGGDPEIDLDAEAKEGFRLGLLEDFGLPFEGEDAVVDDVVHIDTAKAGGILAGSNPRSVLFAVYRFLRLNGCRWLYPGVDGEFIPKKDIAPQKYHKLADYRFRGHCNEGAESQTCMLETIDFYAKQEINVYMIEFDIPFFYYNSYYAHKLNSKNRPPEPVSPDQVFQWKRQCEVEIAKRGLQFHDMGHGWTAEPFGLSSAEGWIPEHVQAVTEEQRKYLAQIKGVRALKNGVALNTNICLSNPESRTIMAKSIVDYAKKHGNVTYLHVWLADGRRNHCECDECQKMRPTDWYLCLMNEVDKLLTEAGLDTRIVFIAYVDTMFAPEKIKIENPKRFSLLYAPITRSYCSSIHKDSVIPPASEYIRNAWANPGTAEECLAHLKEWQKSWKGNTFSYEYHFWKHQYRDMGGMYIARRVYDDIQGLKYMGLQGFVEDGSQRSFFPNGFAIYVYAEALIHSDAKWEDLVKDYFSHIYGKEWKKAVEILEQISNAFDYAYIAGEASENLEKGMFYAPEQIERLPEIRLLAQKEAALAKKHYPAENRPETVSWRLLSLHSEFVLGFAEVMEKKAVGKDDAALEAAVEFIREFGKYEFEIERYFDQFLCMLQIKKYAKGK